MSHAYRQLIQVWTKGEEQLPESFLWRGERYFVTHCNEPWHLLDREWEAADGDPFSCASDRYYYCVIAKAHGHRCDIICDIFHDVANRCWVMERIVD